jgi:hypothetical protein
VRVVNVDEPMTICRKFDLAVVQARGDWIAWWEDDDISLPHRLRRSVQVSRFAGPVSEQRPYKQDNAWAWGPDGVEAETKNLLFGTAFFPKWLYLEAGGAGKMGFPDRNAFTAMLRLVVAMHGNQTWAQELAAPADIFFLYRWAGIGVVHDSGFHGGEGMADPEKRLEEFRFRTLTCPDFRDGPQTVVPGWRVDYAAQVREHLRRLEKGPKRWWEDAKAESARKLAQQAGK